jgi:hypothetical protein
MYEVVLQEDGNLLLVLVVRPLCLDYALHAIDRAGQSVAGDERREVLVQPRDTDAERAGHAFQPDDLVALQELCVCAKSHLAYEPVLVLEEVAVL